jgi:glycosidase
MRDLESTLIFYRRLLALRRESPALQSGSFQMFDAGDDDYLLFERRAGEERFRSR